MSKIKNLDQDTLCKRSRFCARGTRARAKAGVWWCVCGGVGVEGIFKPSDHFVVSLLFCIKNQKKKQ